MGMTKFYIPKHTQYLNLTTTLQINSKLGVYRGKSRS